jgi:hypothetical protein
MKVGLYYDKNYLEDDIAQAEPINKKSHRHKLFQYFNLLYGWCCLARCFQV